MTLYGVIRRINYGAGLVAIEIDAGDFAVAEVVDQLEQVQRGDVLSGDLVQHGSATLRDVTQGFDLQASIQAIGVTRADLDVLLR